MKSNFHWQLLRITLILTVFQGTCVSAERELRVLGFLSITGESWDGGDSCLTAIHMATDDVNANQDILNGYNLTYKWFDSKCHSGWSVYRLSQKLSQDPPYVMLLGAGCSVASESTAEVSYFWNLTQLSFASASPALSDRKRYPRFFRIALPDQMLNPAKLDLMREFNWKKVATINQARQFFSTVIDDFVRRTRDTDITILSQEIFVTNPYNRLLNLKKQDARIIVAAMYEDKARELICAAYKVGLYGTKIVWIFTGWYTPLFWKTNLEAVDCSAEQMSSVVEGAFLASSVYSNPVEERGIANLTVSEFFKRYREHPTYSQSLEDNAFISTFCYDHIWAAALTLNCTIQSLAGNGYPKTLDMFTYSDSDINDMIFSCMSKTSLTGVSGGLVFSTGADPERLVKMERIQDIIMNENNHAKLSIPMLDGERKRFALYRQDKDPKYFEWIEGALIWKDGIIPRDSAYIEYEELKVPVVLSALMLTFAALGIILSVFFLAFNIIYRNNSYVKMSSSNINNVLLLGCMFCYCTVFFNTIPASNVICAARVISFALGFTITFGALFSKTWRVYRIFTNRKLLRLSIKDRQLYVIIVGLVVVVLIVVIIWELVGPHVKQIKILTKEMYMATDGVEMQPFVNICKSIYSDIFGWTLYIIEGALLTFGAFLAWETRNVRIKALNDSYRIGLCLYNVVILSAVGLTFSLILEQEVLIYGITSGCLIIGTTVTQIVIFLPKAVWYRVEGQDMPALDRIGSRTFTAHPSTSFANTDMKSIEEKVRKCSEQHLEAVHKRSFTMPADNSNQN